MSPAQSTKTVSHAEQLQKRQAVENGVRQTLDRGHRVASQAAGAASQVKSLQMALQAAHAEVISLRRQQRHIQGLASLGMATLMSAHELNNLFTSLIGCAQLAARNPSHLERLRDLVLNGCERTQVMCERLLRMKPGNGTKTDENARELVQDALDAFTAAGRDSRKNEIELTVDIPEDLRVRTGRVELQMVLLNLLKNARHALGRRDGEKQIRIAAWREGTAVTLSVSDNGPGVEPTILDDIFEPFFTTKSPTATDDHSGHGLGLTFCRDIVTALGGEIRVESSAGGATFMIRLPSD